MNPVPRPRCGAPIAILASIVPFSSLILCACGCRFMFKLMMRGNQEAT